MSEYAVEVLAGDDYKVAGGTTTRTVVEMGGPKYPLSVPRLGDLMSPARDSLVSADKVILNITSNTFDGYDFIGPVYNPTAALDVAMCNWRADTLVAQGGYLGNQTGPGGGIKGFDLTTIVDGGYMCYVINAIGGYYGDHRVWVDDEPIGSYQIDGAAAIKSGDGGFLNYPGTATAVGNLKFQKRGSYKVRIAGINYVGTSGGIVACNYTSTLRKPEMTRRFGVISDSYFDTNTNTFDTVANNIAALTGWGQWNLAEGGTGFVNPGLASGVDHSYGSDAVFAMLAKAPELEVLIVNGTVNDMAYSTSAAIEKMKALFDRIRSVRPNQKIFWVGVEPVNYFKPAWTDSVIAQREADFAAVALADPNVIGVALPYAEKWLTGSGYQGAANASGNQDFLVGTDSIHLSALGCRHYARLIVERMKACPAYLGAK